MVDRKSSQLPNGSPLQLGDVIQVSRGSQSLSATLQQLLDDLVALGTNTVVVDFGGDGDYTTISEALAFVATQPRSDTSPWVVVVQAGLYVEDNLLVPSYTTLLGQGGSCRCIIKATLAGAAAGNTIVRLGVRATAIGIQAQASQLGVGFDLASDNARCDSCMTQDCLIGYRNNGAGELKLTNCMAARAEMAVGRFPTAGTDAGIVNNAAGSIRATGCTVFTGIDASDPLGYGARSLGVGGQLFLLASSVTGCTAGVTVTSSATVSGGTVTNCTAGVRVNAGATSLDLEAVAFAGNTTWDLSILEGAAAVSGSASIDRLKIQNAVGAVVSLLLTQALDINADLIRIGNVITGDYTEITRDGTLRAHGEATAWDDLRFPAMGQSLDSTTGRLDYDFEECGVGFAANARFTEEPLCFICQMPHSKLHGSAVHPHIHWIQNQAADPNWLIQYRVYNNGEAPPAWQLAKPSTTRTFPYVAGNLLQITKFPAIPAPADESVSAFIDVRLFRDSANTSTLFTGADAYAGTALLKELDHHILIDSLGSRDEYVK